MEEYIICVNEDEWFKERTKEAAYDKAVKIRALNENVSVSIKVRVIFETEIRL